MKIVEMPKDLMGRSINEGFSGGEKKRNEVLQMLLLEPSLAMVLDETDSGLDIDALRVVATGVNHLRGPERSMLVITHYQRLLDYIVPDVVHVLSGGKIVRTGGKELAHELEEKGYGWIEEAADLVSDVLADARDRFLALAEGSTGSGALANLREEGRVAFAEQGLPHTKLEEWRYTRVAPLASRSRGRARATPPAAKRANPCFPARSAVSSSTVCCARARASTRSQTVTTRADWANWRTPSSIPSSP